MPFFRPSPFRRHFKCTCETSWYGQFHAHVSWALSLWNKCLNRHYWIVHTHVKSNEAVRTISSAAQTLSNRALEAWNGCGGRRPHIVLQTAWSVQISFFCHVRGLKVPRPNGLDWNFWGGTHMTKYIVWTLQNSLMLWPICERLLHKFTMLSYGCASAQHFWASVH